MISAQHGMYFPQRSASPQRTLMTLTFVLISLSGLLAGISLRQAVQLVSSHPLLSSQNQSHTQPLVQPKATAISTTQLPAQFFGISLGLSSYTVQPGDTITVSANVRTQKESILVQGVSVIASIVGPTTLLSTVAASSDTNGIATWTIPIPASAQAGLYTVNAVAHWAEYSASYQITLTVK